jgi:anti-sigma-K factor RskA
MDRETLLELIPAYALDALDADERQAVENLLAQDVEARRLLADYQQITDALVLAVPARPAPPHLTDDLRQRLAQQRPAASAPPARPALRRVPLTMRLLAVAAVLVVIFGLVALLDNLQPRPTVITGQALYSQLDQQAGALRLAVQANENAPQVEGELLAAPDGSQAVIAVRNLPVLGEDETFQLWLNGPGGVVSGGLFQAEGEDTPTYILLPITEPLTAYRGFGVSREAAGGSPFPDRPAGTGVFRVVLES